MDPVARLTSGESYFTDPQQWNAYAYARNNPVKFVDPSGQSSATYNQIPEGGWQYGDVMGQFNGVDSHYNGIGSLSTEHSCVEYAKRYNSQIYGINMGSVVDPNTLWNNVDALNKRLETNNSSYFFAQHINGEGFVLPKEGDLLIWTDKSYGHIMVVTESDFDNTKNTGYVEIIDQNASNKAVRAYNVNKTDKGYSIMKNDKTAMAGWLSPINKNDNTIIDNGKKTVTTQSSQTQQQSFIKSVWNKASSFFKNIFNKH